MERIESILSIFNSMKKLGAISSYIKWGNSREVILFLKCIMYKHVNQSSSLWPRKTRLCFGTYLKVLLPLVFTQAN